MRISFLKDDGLSGFVLSNDLNGGAGNDPDIGGDSTGKRSGEVGRERPTSNDSNELPYVVGNVDSKTKGFERYADCFENKFGPCNSIKMDILNRKVFRI